ncbi:MAG: cytochrome c-type biogenesis protein CcmH [Armatimonadetes bacterium]|nr:cytochrome c-type biogenesis protein CcmH [Armatimonadota bacterium]
MNLNRPGLTRKGFTEMADPTSHVSSNGPRVVIVCVLLQLMGVPVATPAFSVSERDISGELVCLCGCGNMPIRDCECSNAQKIRGEIRNKVKGGLSKREILDYFMDKYGEEIVGAPPPWKGFNVAAWIMPFLSLAAGSIVFVRFVKSRKAGDSDYTREGEETNSSPEVRGKGATPLESRLDQELKDYE